MEMPWLRQRTAPGVTGPSGEAIQVLPESRRDASSHFPDMIAPAPLSARIRTAVLFTAGWLFLGTLQAQTGEGSRTRKKDYDVTANGTEQIAAALVTAKAEKKRVLVHFGANWVSWCFALNKMFRTEQVKAALEKDFVVVAIDVNQGHNAEVDLLYEHPTKYGLPTIIVLDAEGKLLTTKATSELEKGNGHDAEAFLKWLQEWTPKA